ncbi:aldo/keto reductase [Streptomyces mobaraensis]|uniref:aldo/keto reductase n=1 Tax=Streptomyces mobaraensis TaxID=35621 RepID=UPI0033247E1A
MSDKHRHHTRKIGSLSVHPLALGGNVFGWTADKDQSFAVLDAYAAAGGNFIDTADAYSAWAPGNSGGESETIIGDWMASRRNRDDIVVATKVGAGYPERPGLSAAVIKEGIENSLRRLRTDYVDLYYTHYDDPSLPVEDYIATLDGLVKEGKVREIAASNVTPERLARALEFSDSAGLAKYVAIQPEYNLVARDGYEGPLAEVAARHSLAAVPYYSLASGFLTGKYRPDATVDSARAEGAARHLKTERGLRVLAALDEIAAAHDAEVATVALAWLASRPTVATPLASARTVEQLPPLLALADLRLSEEELERLTEASA